jgi:ABC-type transport system involved in multi-copper enzyme maturation permease subunit
MNWLTLRQFRTQAVAGYAALAALAAVFLITGIQLYGWFTDSGLARCLTRAGADCTQLSSNFSSRYDPYQWFLPLVLIAPALIGMFWGAPLVARELENGTHRLVWTQGITRRRWITSKLTVAIGSAIVASGILALVLTWWSSAIVKAEQWIRLDFGPFDLTGIVPIAYTVFAVALGVALGALIRKTLPAIFATLAVFGVVRVLIVTLLREHYMAAKTSLTPFKAEGPTIMVGGRDWILSSEIVDRTGAAIGEFGFTPQTLADRCPDLLAPGQLPEKINAGRCLSRLGLQVSETFHPDSRFWAFQGIESAIFLGLAAALIAFVIWRVKRVS